MAAPRKFTEAQLHEAALGIVDREGLPALTMRRLAEALARSGRAGFELLAAFRLVSGFVTGFALSEVTGLLARTPGGTAAELQARIAALIQGRLARLAEIAAVGVPGNPEREFQAGLEIVIAGLKATAAKSVSRRRRSV